MNQNLKDFYFFSDFLNRKVLQPFRAEGGQDLDLVAERAEPYPMIIGLVGREQGGEKKALPPLGEDDSNRAPDHLS